MGNRGSRSVDTSAAQVGDDAGAVTQSGVFLSNELQAEILNSFESEQLKTQWEKVQFKILTGQRERINEAEVRKTEIDEQFAQWKIKNQTVQASLDEQIGGLKAKYGESFAAVNKKVVDLEEKIGTAPKFGGDDACADVRMSLVNCYKGTDDIRKCDDIVNAMELCAKKAVMK